MRYIIFIVLINTCTKVFSQIWKESINRVSRLEYLETLKYWDTKYNQFLKVENIGESDGESIFMLKITDSKVPDENKQVALITALHGGPERSGTTTVLSLVEWLLSDDAVAIETRQKQILLLIPIILPKSFFETDEFRNSFGIDPYTGNGTSNWDLESLSFKFPDMAPEIMALLNVVDTYKPEVHLDFHGTGVQAYTKEQRISHESKRFKGQLMFESTGSALSNSVLRSWDWRVMESMIQSGLNAGYPSDRLEADAQRMHWSRDLMALEDKLWLGRPQFYTALYSYFKYHTMLVCMEVGWEKSGVEKAKGLLQIGNNIWYGEKEPGYPVNRLYAFYGKYITAWGQSTLEYRKSREELWENTNNFRGGVLYPEVEGRESFIFSISDTMDIFNETSLEGFLTKIEDQSINFKEIKKFIETGPYVRLVWDKNDKPRANIEKEFKVLNGMGIRIRIPYANAKIEKMKLNGYELGIDPCDGYETWIGNDGHLHVQINIPPEKTKGMGYAILTCEYKPDIKREYGWSPPSEVIKLIKGK